MVHWFKYLSLLLSAKTLDKHKNHRTIRTQWWFQIWQESPPAWTQEAYRLPPAALSPDRGVPHRVLTGGTPSNPDRGRGYPHPVLGRGYPWVSPILTWDLTWMGVLPIHLGWGYSHLNLGWGNPLPDLGRGMPHPYLGIGYPLLAGWGYPQCKCEQTDIPKYKYYLSTYFVRGR